MNAVDEIIAKASELADNERATIAARLRQDCGKIAARLIEGLPAPSYDVSDEEVEKRKRELESGAVEDISLDELKAGLKL